MSYFFVVTWSWEKLSQWVYKVGIDATLWWDPWPPFPWLLPPPIIFHDSSLSPGPHLCSSGWETVYALLICPLQTLWSEILFASRDTWGQVPLSAAQRADQVLSWLPRDFGTRSYSPTEDLPTANKNVVLWVLVRIKLLLSAAVRGHQGAGLPVSLFSKSDPGFLLWHFRSPYRVLAGMQKHLSLSPALLRLLRLRDTTVALRLYLPAPGVHESHLALACSQDCKRSVAPSGRVAPSWRATRILHRTFNLVVSCGPNSCPPCIIIPREILQFSPEVCWE